MRKWCYESGSNAHRAAVMRADGVEAARRGFATIGEVNAEMAEWLAPTPLEPRSDTD